MGNTAANDIRRANTADRRRQALELRKAGASYETIAEKLKFGSRQNARRAILAAFKDIVQEPAEEVRLLELQRYDVMLLALWSKVRLGNEKAIDTALRVSERRARLLGIDLPPAVTELADSVRVPPRIEIVYAGPPAAKLPDRIP